MTNNRIFLFNAPLRLFIMLCRRLIRAGRHAESDAKTIPSIDGDYRGGQIDQLFVRELRPGLLKYVVRHMLLADQSDRLRPSQSRSLAVGVERSLAPCVERV